MKRSIFNPSTAEVIRQVEDSTSSEVDNAIENAQSAFEIWSGFTPGERFKKILDFADLLLKHADDICKLEVEETGKPYSRITGYIAEGLFKSQEEIDNSPAQNLGSTPKVGDIKYRDLNGDGIIDSDDQTMISKYGSTPRLQYGFGGTVNYKKFDFGVFFSGSALRSIMTNGIDPFQEGIAVGNRNVLKYKIIKYKVLTFNLADDTMYL